MSWSEVLAVLGIVILTATMTYGAMASPPASPLDSPQACLESSCCVLQEAPGAVVLDATACK